MWYVYRLRWALGNEHSSDRMQRHELAGLGGDTHFLKQQLDLQHNIPLLDSRAVGLGVRVRSMRIRMLMVGAESQFV